MNKLKVIHSEAKCMGNKIPDTADRITTVRVPIELKDKDWTELTDKDLEGLYQTWTTELLRRRNAVR